MLLYQSYRKPSLTSLINTENILKCLYRKCQHSLRNNIPIAFDLFLALVLLIQVIQVIQVVGVKAKLLLKAIRSIPHTPLTHQRKFWLTFAHSIMAVVGHIDT